MRCSSCLIGIAEAAKHSQEVIVMWCTEQKLKWTARTTSLTRPDIEKICSCSQCFSPEGCKHAGMKKHTMDAVIQCAECAFVFPVLGRGVRTRKTQGHTVDSKMTAKSMVVKFSPIVRLNSDKWKLKLGTHIGMEMN